MFAGRPPDFLAFVITILMTMLMAAGVKKSLAFNNVLNALNLAVWVFVMTAGLFYVDTSNWTEHKGFLPYGWPGVSEYLAKGLTPSHTIPAHFPRFTSASGHHGPIMCITEIFH
jgi:amino acid transporter